MMSMASVSMTSLTLAIESLMAIPKKDSFLRPSITWYGFLRKHKRNKRMVLLYTTIILFSKFHVNYPPSSKRCSVSIACSVVTSTKRWGEHRVCVTLFLISRKSLTSQRTLIFGWYTKLRKTWTCTTAWSCCSGRYSSIPRKWSRTTIWITTLSTKSSLKMMAKYSLLIWFSQYAHFWRT